MMNIVLMGGGFDSAAVAKSLHGYKHPIVANLIGRAEVINIDLLFHVDYGQKAADAEYRAIKNLGKHLGVATYQGKLDLSFSSAGIMKGTGVSSDVKSKELAVRNPLLASYAASYGASVSKESEINIYVGLHVEPADTFPDGKPDWMEPLAAALTVGSHKTIRIIAPMLTKTHEELATYVLTHLPENCWHTCFENEECHICHKCQQADSYRRALNNDRDVPNTWTHTPVVSF